MTKAFNYQKKGLGYYINRILNREAQTSLTVSEMQEINKFDDGVLLIDDLLDKSKIRNGKKCYYRAHGAQKTRQLANELIKESKEALKSIAFKHGLSVKQTQKAVELLKELKKNIEVAQRIDRELQKTKRVTKGILDKYDRMIKLFTGNHIKTGFAIGYLLTNSNPKEKQTILKIGQQSGIIRQIEDDLNDYKKKHHEPLGDLIHHKKRLPELLFLLNSTEKEKKLLESKLQKKNINIHEIKKIIFTPKVKKLITEKIHFHKKRIDLLTKKLPKRKNLQFT